MSSDYLKWAEQTIVNFSNESINNLYNEGYVFTRLSKGIMHQTRSVRIDLSKFELSSENRRILKKTSDFRLQTSGLPLKEYNWEIGKMAKDFYETKFGDGTFSANKIKELMTDTEKSNFNALLVYSINEEKVGYCIARETDELLHYSYPFYHLSPITYHSDIGLGMMIQAIVWAKENKKRYVFLGSAQRPTDTYKLQFTGLEWFNSKSWSSDTQELKEILHSAF